MGAVILKAMQRLEVVQKAPDARCGKNLSGGVLVCALKRKIRSRNAADGLFRRPPEDCRYLAVGRPPARRQVLKSTEERNCGIKVSKYAG